MTTSIAFIDIIGLTYDANTINQVGLGGSESAIIYMSKELARLGFDVTVFNNCIDTRCTEGVFEDVKYLDLRRLHEPHDYKFDVVISSRTVIPYLFDHQWKEFNYPHPTNPFKQIVSSAKLKLLWLHDTFCSGDHFLEELVVAGAIDEIFTLSDFHTSYITNCDHGKRRNFEVLKNKVFMTRNGARKYIDEVDITKKHPAKFVYNASVTKGMIPLLERIWPMVKREIPEATLTVIGGFYRFRDGTPPDAQEVKFNEMAANKHLAQLGVTFTGVIPQRDIADILAEASFMIFPGAFPETFGISTLESLLYNTPLITTRFGALEETAVDLACYKIDYAIEPNSLFQRIDVNQQCIKFVQEVVKAYRNKYLHQQKMQYCNIVHDIAGWDTVALQWKQHIYKKLGLYLSVAEYRKVMRINHKVHEVFGRRFSNAEELVQPSPSYEKRITVITPFYNAEDYIEDCIMSVAQQDYDNYRCILIDDNSTDGSAERAVATINRLPVELHYKFTLIEKVKNVGAVCNQATEFMKIKDDQHSSIVMLLDGDDSLVNDNTIFKYYNEVYEQGAEFTYGSCWSLVDNIPLIAQPYPNAVKQARAYRNHRFAWNMPYTHLRTFKSDLIAKLDFDKLKDEDGNWYRAGGDTSIFYELIEQANPDAVRALQKIVYNYNDKNPLNDYKVNGEEQTRTANKVLGQRTLLAVYDPVVTEEEANQTWNQSFKPQITDLRNP